MGIYVDGFVLPIARDRIEEYKRIGEAASKVFKEHGALEYWECIGDDLNIEGTRSFVDAVGAKSDETVVFSWVMYESREARDKANEKICVDPRLTEMLDMSQSIVDPERMAYGGFQPLVGEVISRKA